jgi:hypothetical protein
MLPGVHAVLPAPESFIGVLDGFISLALFNNLSARALNIRHPRSIKLSGKRCEEG